jgi:nicotinamidase-related amidase
MQTPTTLIDRDDSLLVVIDCQDGFLKKLEAQRRDMVLGTIGFLIDVTGRLDIPAIVSVEEPVRHGPTVPALSTRLPPGTPEYAKSAFSITDDPALCAALTAQPRRTAVLVGLETDVCVLHSAVGLHRLGFRVVIVADATASPTPEHAFGLDRARSFGLEVVRVKGLCYEWTRTVAAADNVFGEGGLRAPAGLVL